MGCDNGVIIDCLEKFFTFLLVVLPVNAQVFRTVDMTATHGRKAFYVVFAARGESSTGHAFVIWGIEDAQRKMSTVEALGLYPESDASNCNVLVGTVPGRLMDELANHSVQGIAYAL